MIRNIWAYSPEKRKAAYRSGQFAKDGESAQSVGLAGWWPLGVHPGNADDLDYSGFKNHGVRTGGPTRQVVNNPMWGAAHTMQFDGTDDYIDTGSVVHDGMNNRITVSAWIKPVNAGAVDAICGERTPGGWAFFQLQDNLRFTIFGVTDSDSVNFPITIDNVWTHVAVTYDKVSIDFYYNGALLTSNAQTGSITAATNSLYIGAYNSNGSAASFWDGQLDDIRVHSNALNATEIRTLYQEPWRLVRPRGIRTISFAPAVAAAAGPPKGTLALLGVGI